MKRLFEWFKSLIARLLLFAGVSVICAGCSSAPPGSYGVNAFGIGATYSTPGWQAQPKVVTSPIITTPTLLVPADSPAASATTAVATNGQVVPVVIAPVATETLAVPAK